MKAMWTFEYLVKWQAAALIGGNYVPARPLNYRKEYCSLWRRIKYAWQVVLGNAETFEWPVGQ